MIDDRSKLIRKLDLIMIIGFLILVGLSILICCTRKNNDIKIIEKYEAELLQE